MNLTDEGLPPRQGRRGLLSSLFIFIFLVAGNAYAAGYRIPEQSANSTALSASYVAGAHGADSAYYNPANMVREAAGAVMEAGVSHIIIPPVEFNGTVGGVSADSESKSERLYLPNFHYVSPPVGDFRFGLSLTAPFGLSKRWGDQPQRLTTEEFTLKVLELNPSIGYRISDRVSAGGGIRVIHATGTVRSDGTTLVGGVLPTRLTRNMEGSDTSVGYNLALTIRPVERLALSATYRSEVKPVFEGNAALSSTNALGTAAYDGGGSVEVVLPAALNLAVAYAGGGTTLEFVFERTFWGEYRELDFNYDAPLNSSILTASFDDPVPKNWKDSNTYRFGITHRYGANLSLMAGFAVDRTPVPEETLGFEMPGADGVIFSGGVRYEYGEKLSVGLGGLYLRKEKRSVSNSSISGEFSSRAYLLSLSFGYVLG